MSFVSLVPSRSLALGDDRQIMAVPSAKPAFKTTDSKLWADLRNELLILKTDFQTAILTEKNELKSTALPFEDVQTRVPVVSASEHFKDSGYKMRGCGY